MTACPRACVRSAGRVEDAVISVLQMEVAPLRGSEREEGRSESGGFPRPHGLRYWLTPEAGSERDGERSEQAKVVARARPAPAGRDQGQPAAYFCRKQEKSCTFSVGGEVLASQLA